MRLFDRLQPCPAGNSQMRSAEFIPRVCPQLKNWRNEFRAPISGFNARYFRAIFALLATSLALMISALDCHATDELSPANLYGTNFSISVPNVEAVEYTAILGFMETDATAAGQRVFDIEYAGQLVASNLDVFAAAGGAGKPYFLIVPVKHAADLEGG